MALSKLTDIQKIARDCYTGNVEKYSKNAANDVLRAEIIERVGGNWTYTNFQKNKWSVYELLQEVIDVDLVNLSEEAFKQFCETKNFELGDAPEFKIKNNSLFRVGIIGTGINSTRRQRKLGSKVRTDAFKLAIASYEELDRFIAGRIDWKEYVDTVVASFNHEIATQIVGAFGQAYSEIGTNLKASVLPLEPNFLCLLVEFIPVPIIPTLNKLLFLILNSGASPNSKFLTSQNCLNASSDKFTKSTSIISCNNA